MADPCPVSDEALARVNFRCKPCQHSFAAPPGRIEEAPERTWHPYLYYADCPRCAGECEQAPWEKGLMAACGPRTPEGKAKVTKNLAGHPTPEEALRTRFNALKHGASSRTALYFPARPGKYPHCDGCEHLNTDCGVLPGCLKRTELFLKHQMAFESGNPATLLEMRSDTQAALQAMLNDMLCAVSHDGVVLRTPEWYYDKDGGFHLAGYTDEQTGKFVQIMKLEEHPLLRRVMEYVSKNNLTLSDLMMTPKAQEDHALLEGFIEGDKGDPESAHEFRQRIEQQQSALLKLFDQSYTARPTERVIEGSVEDG